EDVSLRPAEPSTLVQTSKALHQRAVGDLLQLRIERRRDRKPILIQRFGAVLALEVLPHVFHEERRDSRRLRWLAAGDDWTLLGGVGLGLLDVAFAGQPLENDVAALGCALHVHERTLPLRTLEQPRDQRRLIERELPVRLVEVQTRRGLDAVSTVAQIHL